MELEALLSKVRRMKIVNRLTVEQRLAGEFRSAQRGLGMDFEQVRPYQPGDDIRRIDWNVSARSQQTYIKEYKQERELCLLLAVDLSASGHFGDAGRLKQDVTQELAAILAFTSMRNNYRLGALTFTDQVEHYSRPGRGRRHMVQLLSHMVQPTLKGRGTNLTAALSYLCRIQRQRTLVVLISDMLDEGYEDALKKTLARHELLVLRPYHPREVPEALPGLLPVADLEHGHTQWSLKLWGKNSTLGKAYTDRTRQAEELCQRLGIRYLPIDITEDYLPKLESFLSDRPQRSQL